MPSSRVKPDLPPVPEKITLSEAVTVKELAEKLNRKSKDIIAKLMTRGVLANINQPLDPTVAIEVAKEFGSAASIVTFEEEVQHAPAAQASSAEKDATGDRFAKRRSSARRSARAASARSAARRVSRPSGPVGSFQPPCCASVNVRLPLLRGLFARQLGAAS